MMTNEAKFHPTVEQLGGFARGTLTAGMNVVVSAHVELCDDCRGKISSLEAEAAAEMLQEIPEARPSNKEFSSMVDSIVNHPQMQLNEQGSDSVTKIHMLEHSVSLPKVLVKVASEGLVWKKLAGGINQASVTLDDQTQCEFLYMKPGSQVPVHKHQGSEVTLVLDGSFSDELGHYKQSDFVVRTASDMHQPASEEGCLCFAVLDSPLTFTKGLARLLNPFIRYRFRRATAAASL
jgi:putative transcriptional regulator